MFIVFRRKLLAQLCWWWRHKRPTTTHKCSGLVSPLLPVDVHHDLLVGWMSWNGRVNSAVNLTFNSLWINQYWRYTKVYFEIFRNKFLARLFFTAASQYALNVTSFWSKNCMKISLLFSSHRVFWQAYIEGNFLLQY